MNHSILLNKSNHFNNNRLLLSLLIVETLLLLLTLVNVFLPFILVVGVVFLFTLVLLFENKPVSIIYIMLASILAGSINAFSFSEHLPLVYFADVIFVLAFLVLLLKFFINNKDLGFKFSTIELLFIGYLVACLLSNAFSIDVVRGFAYYKWVVINFVFFVFCLKYIEKKEQLKSFFYFLMIWGLLLSVIQTVHILQQGNILITIATKNIHLSWGSSNYLAAFYVLLIPMGLSVLFTRKLKFKNYLLVFTSLVFMMVALIMTASRGGFIALAAGFFLLLFRYRNWKTFVLFLLLMSVFALMVYYVPAARFVWDGIANFQSSSSVFSRIGTWIEGYRIFLDHPLLGVGLGSMHHYVNNYYILLTADFTLLKAHNIFLELLVETGILGFIFFTWLLYKVYAITVKNLAYFKGFNHSLAWGFFTGLGAAFVHSLVEPTILTFNFGLIFFAVVALVIKQNEFRDQLLEQDA